MITRTTIESALLSPLLEEGWTISLGMWDGDDPAEAEAMGAWIRDRRDDYLKVAEEIDEPEALSIIIAYMYIHLKSEWTIMNTRVNYGMVATGMPDMKIMFRASLLTGLIETLEGLLKYRDLQYITGFLAEPVQEKGVDNAVLEVEATYLDSVFRYMDEMTMSHTLMGGSLAKMANIVGERQEAERQSRIINDCMNHLMQAYSHLDRNTTDFQRSVVKLRTTSCKDLSEKMDEFVGYTSAREQKDISFKFSGKEVEIEKISGKFLQQPLLDLLRATILFGIDAPDVRKAAGKKPRAEILVTASHHGSHVVLQIEDDGHGFDLQMVERDVRLGDCSIPPGFGALSESEWIEKQMFATQADLGEEASEHRGSSLKAIHDKIVELGGTLAVRTSPNGATCFRLTVPACSTIVSLMLVRVGNNRYGLPLDTIREVCSVRSDTLFSALTRPFIELRGLVVPVVFLRDLLNEPDAAAPDDGAETTMLVVQVGEKMVALAVTSIVDNVNCVMKPLTGVLSEGNLVLGATILSDGGIVMVLDTFDIFKTAAQNAAA